jgi:hypothetical protein
MMQKALQQKFKIIFTVASFAMKNYAQPHLNSVMFLTIVGDATRGNQEQLCPLYVVNYTYSQPVEATYPHPSRRHLGKSTYNIPPGRKTTGHHCATLAGNPPRRQRLRHHANSAPDWLFAIGPPERGGTQPLPGPLEPHRHL